MKIDNKFDYIKQHLVSFSRHSADDSSISFYLIYLQHDLEQLDPRGRTPLMLAVKLCHQECVKALLTAKCNANFECDGWSGKFVA